MAGWPNSALGSVAKLSRDLGWTNQPIIGPLVARFLMFGFAIRHVFNSNLLIFHFFVKFVLNLNRLFSSAGITIELFFQILDGQCPALILVIRIAI